jgi:Ni,Fe-hydrogenase III small subunit
LTQWVVKGLGTGVRTTRYPFARDSSPGVTPGLPGPGEFAPHEINRLVERCPTGALAKQDRQLAVDTRRCVHCFRCTRGPAPAAPWHSGYEWARGESALGKAFARSIHIRVVDAGDCGACLREVKQLAGPYYNLHRLGFFITPTPRQADVLLVVGAGTDQMRQALAKTYAAMPTPHVVIAVGACALSGGIFGPSFVCSGGIGTIIPVDVEVPGNPPPPLAILHALLLATGRAAPSVGPSHPGASEGPP